MGKITFKALPKQAHIGYGRRMSFSLGDQLRFEKSQFANQLQDKDSVSSVFLIKYGALVPNKNGKPYLNIVLMDRSGEVEARVWDHAQQMASQAIQDNFVWVEGRCQFYQGRKQVIIQKLQVLREDQVDPKQFLPQSQLDADALYATLLESVSRMKCPYYRALVESVVVHDEDAVTRLKKAPAAKSMHHAYPVGLLEHVCSVVGLLEKVADHYGDKVDRDLMVLGGIFHDIGKLWELSYEKTYDYTTEGRLIGHLVMGVELIERKIQLLDQSGKLPGLFPEEKRLLSKHMVLAHHGELEYGSPKRPKCLEALIVHEIDDLDSKINAIQKFIQADQNPGEWTALNRTHERYFYKGTSKNNTP